MKFLALAVTCLTFSLDGACADEPAQWFADSHDGQVYLTYGVPESDGIGISFSCELPTRELTIWLYIDPGLHPYSKEDQVATITITTTPSTERLVMTGSLANPEDEDYAAAEARGRINVSLARMLKQGKTLDVTVGKEKMSFPLKGAAAEMKPLVDCAEAAHKVGRFFVPFLPSNQN